ncbi:hypothetical protein GDO81_008378 [Engystomops pustulosus]|uniref:RRM domain-containing protein n=2 Tax=Engystomops pustulosus TaxID=76066 RepID=A0AAV7CF78_ENGPU|nr:hypothetical protein GDO81_008378 [Engystomops pustulosus]
MLLLILKSLPIIFCLFSPLVPDSMNNSLFQQLAEHLQQQNLEHLRHQFLEQQHTPKMTAQVNQDIMSESENSATPSQDDSQQAFMEKEAQLHTSLSLQPEDMDIDDMQDVTEEIFEKEEKKTIKDERPRARSRSRSRSPRKRRSRSRSGSRKRKHRKRSRSRSRERKRKTSRSYSSERRAREREKEREKERQKKGLPPIRSKTLSVCSTTLWVGQVDKKATQQDLTNVFEEFGQIESINMIPPRGCAYVCMVHRQDAFRALQKLSSGSCKIGSKIIKIAWALNKGVKTEYKQFWDVDLGVTYIPWEKVKLDDLEDFAEGGMIDQETVNNEWQTQRNAEPVAVKEPAPAPVPITTVQSPIVPKTSIITTQPEAYNPPVAMLQIPVTPTVPAVSLVPPAFPVSMSVPPPGYTALPPPPFMRAGFNPSQPPPGFIPPPVPPPAIPPPSLGSTIPTALVPRLPMSTDSIKEVSYSSLMLPIPSVVTTSVSTPSMFNPSSSSHADQEEKRTALVVDNINERIAASSTQNTVVSSAGILGVQPQPVPPLAMGGRIAAMPFLDIRPGLLHQPATARFTLITPAMPPPPPPRSLIPPTLMDPTLHSLPFAQGEIFPHPAITSRLNNENARQEECVGLQSSNIQQEGDQDYRFPPIESRETVSQSSGVEQKQEGMPLVASQENEGASSGKDININARHVEDDHEPQDMAVVDPCEGQEKLVTGSLLGQLSPEGAHKGEREAEMHPHESFRGPDLHSFEIKVKNASDAHDVPSRPQLEPRHFGSPQADTLLPFGRHQHEIRENFGRLPLEGRDHFGRQPPEGRDHHGRPPVDGRDHYGRPVLEGRNSFGRLPMDGREMFGRPPLDIRDHFGRPDRREQFPHEKPWGHRGDFDERPHPPFSGFGGPKGFPDDRPRHGNYRHEHRNAPGWNRGFEAEAPRDYDDRRRSWERHRDRDDRDFGFRREMNGNRFGRERQSGNWMPPQPQHLEYFPETTKGKADEVPQVNGEMPETGNQPKTDKSTNDPELCKKETPDKMNEEKDAKEEKDVKSQPVVESTETEGT